eukprot:1798570-Rhodomonas_salina.1
MRYFVLATATSDALTSTDFYGDLPMRCTHEAYGAAAIDIDARYALSGTDIGYGAARPRQRG